MKYPDMFKDEKKTGIGGGLKASTNQLGPAPNNMQLGATDSNMLGGYSDDEMDESNV